MAKINGTVATGFERVRDGAILMGMRWLAAGNESYLVGFRGSDASWR